MNIPPGSNGFYLEGAFEGEPPITSDGWRMRMADHYSNEMPEAQQVLFEDADSYAWHAVKKFSLNNEPQRLVDEAVTPIAAHEVPRYFKTRQDPKNLAALARFAGNVLTVNEALKQFIEWLEPGVHHFFPIEIRMPRNRVHPDQHYILVIGQHLDSFSPARSAQDSFKVCLPGLYSYSENAPQARKLAFRREAFGNAHLWRERHILGFLTCFSDRLHAEITDAGLRIPKQFPMIEV
ncbi:hypothetical protein HZY97_15665 [Sphingomonas sp. R-74633]|uniref:imm11 family protein n=1 Tax=Sphingomonas sp. R-74633 TaxID=2751188 RepID=UPI0015D170C3|nr:DUF1629 domain-containing protein [Sphingomonas sp. R-74633]NYT42209.1 hypothetical protein [Sphingomonas sp. R-74633]